MRKQSCVLGLAFCTMQISCRSSTEEPKQEPLAKTSLASRKTSVTQKDRTAEYVRGSLYRFEPALPAQLNATDAQISEEQISLGRQLFFDTRLSKNHDVSCNSCHLLSQYGVDGEKTSPGHLKQRGKRNSPTVYNAAGHFVQFWDGRSKNVEHQATEPVLNPLEMAMPNEKRVVETLGSIPHYVTAFRTAFPDEKNAISLTNVGKALGAFERRLVTPSKWDKFLLGNKSALSQAEQKGFLTFINTGCVTCHLGTMVGGSVYQKAGAVKPWPNQTDQGRFEVTGNESDRMVFKVPSLRNVDKTAPYFHDGSAATLHEAVTMMGIHQLGRELPEEEIQAIITWLKTLTGALPSEYIIPPPLPKSTTRTPQPDPT